MIYPRSHSSVPGLEPRSTGRPKPYTDPTCHPISLSVSEDSGKARKLPKVPLPVLLLLHPLASFPSLLQRHTVLAPNSLAGPLESPALCALGGGVQPSTCGQMDPVGRGQVLGEGHTLLSAVALLGVHMCSCVLTTLALARCYVLLSKTIDLLTEES